MALQKKKKIRIEMEKILYIWENKLKKGKKKISKNKEMDDTRQMRRQADKNDECK